MEMIPRPSAINYISLKDAREAIKAGIPLIDIRIPEAYGESHIAGAENICVYEVAFGEKFAASFPKEDTKVVIYGESSKFRAAEMAFGRLKQMGYHRVTVLEDGLEAWQRAGLKMASGGLRRGPMFPKGQLILSMEKSALRWTGRNLTNQHRGRIELVSGSLEISRSGDVVAGKVLVDMQKITCEDIENPGMNKVLIEHLGNIDFFDVENFPEGSFTIVQTERLVGGPPGQPNFRIYGEMELRGVTRVIEFKAMINPVPDGISFQAQVEVNRVNFGAVYGSGSLFERLGMHLVNDLVTIDLTLIFESP
jgi:rhodanese-related sulfurtransferase/polyisoprenoid-binding protein YceI